MMTAEGESKRDFDYIEDAILPVFKRHGMENGSRIVTEVRDVLVRMNDWPDDIKDSCVEELLRILSLSKPKSE